MNQAGLEKRVCSICLSVGTEFYMFQSKFKYLLGLINTSLPVEVSEESFSCCDCLDKLVELSHFKKICESNEEKIRSKVLETGKKINLAEVVLPDRENKYEVQNICRLCLTLFDENLLSNLLTQIDGISLGNMFQSALPDVLLDISYSPFFCAECTEKIKLLYMFNKKYMETEQKINTYVQNTGTNIRKTDKVVLLLNVIQYFQEGKGAIVDAKKSPSFFNYFCELCDFKTITRATLIQHIVQMHPVDCVLITGTSLEASESSNLNITADEELSVTSSNAVNGEKSSDNPDAGEDMKSYILGDIDSGEEALVSSTSSDKGTSRETRFGIEADTGEINEIFKCTMCDIYITYKIRNFKKHVARHMKKLNIHKCLVCDFSADTKDALTKHNLEEHPEDHCFKCDTCDFTTGKDRNLKNHIKRHHKKEKVCVS